MTASRASHITHPSGLTLPRSVVNHSRVERAQKITWDQAYRIRNLYSSGATYRDLIAQFNVSRSTVDAIINHRGKWK